MSNRVRWNGLANDIIALLMELGDFFGVSEYTLPGKKHSVDIYIPAIPRTLVEIVASRDERALEDAYSRLLASIRKINVKSLAVLVAPNIHNRPSVELRKNEKHSVHILRIPHKASIEEAAKMAAEEIIKLHTELRETIMPTSPSISGVGGIAGSILGACANAQFPILGSIVLSSIPILKLVRGQSEEVKNRRRSTSDIGLHSPNDQALSPYEKTSTILLRTMADLVSQDSLHGLHSEMGALLDEMEAEHFTACALRAGRALEYIVYLLAKEWGVRVDEPALKFLVVFEQRFLELRRLFIRYAYSEDREALTDKKKAFVSKAAELQKWMTMELSSLDTTQEFADFTGSKSPKQVEAIIREIRHQYSHIRIVREETTEIIELIDAVLQVRNIAAHADLGGECYEVPKDAVDDMISDLHQIVDRLTIIGQAIGEAVLDEGA